MITGGTSSTERCVTGMTRNDYLLQKNDATLHELRLPQNELIGMALPIPESISISSIQHY